MKTVRKGESSYIENRLDHVFRTTCFFVKPKKIVEFGILNGYSLKLFIESSDEDCEIEAYDLFDEFPYNAAKWDVINKKYGEECSIKKGDFYKSVELIPNNSVDIMHIDIANDANVFKFGIDNYLPKIKEGGVIIFEGGSKERDEVYWMDEFDKPKINPYLESVKNDYNITIIEDFPSITIVKK